MRRTIGRLQNTRPFETIDSVAVLAGVSARLAPAPTPPQTAGPPKPMPIARPVRPARRREDPLVSLARRASVQLATAQAWRSGSPIPPYCRLALEAAARGH